MTQLAEIVPAEIVLPPTVIPVQGYVWIESCGAVNFTGSGFAGFRGRSLRMEGFSIQITPPPGQDVSIQYVGWLQDRGEVPWVTGPSYLGTINEELRLEAFAIRLTGTDAYIYTVEYLAHEESHNDIGRYTDGQVCGLTGQSLRLEGLAVSIRVR